MFLEKRLLLRLDQNKRKITSMIKGIGFLGFNYYTNLKRLNLLKLCLIKTII
jgi:hypothetical protein